MYMFVELLIMQREHHHTRRTTKKQTCGARASLCRGMDTLWRQRKKRVADPLRDGAMQATPVKRQHTNDDDVDATASSTPTLALP